MRFLRKSLMGLFLLAATLALFAYAIMMVRGAIENKGDDQRRGGGGRERIFAVNAVPFEPGQHIPVLQVFGEVQSQRSLDIRPALVERSLSCTRIFKMAVLFWRAMYS